MRTHASRAARMCERPDVKVREPRMNALAA